MRKSVEGWPALGQWESGGRSDEHGAATVMCREAREVKRGSVLTGFGEKLFWWADFVVQCDLLVGS
jgi:hypothetical protein